MENIDIASAEPASTEPASSDPMQTGEETDLIGLQNAFHEYLDLSFEEQRWQMQRLLAYPSHDGEKNAVKEDNRNSKALVERQFMNAMSVISMESKRRKQWRINVEEAFKISCIDPESTQPAESSEPQPSGEMEHTTDAPAARGGDGHVPEAQASGWYATHAHEMNQYATLGAHETNWPEHNSRTLKAPEIDWSAVKLPPINEHNVDGHTGNEHAVNEKVDKGDAAKEDAAKEDAVSGEEANGHAASGEEANGHAAKGKAVNGHAANGHEVKKHAAWFSIEMDDDENPILTKPSTDGPSTAAPLSPPGLLTEALPVRQGCKHSETEQADKGKSKARATETVSDDSDDFTTNDAGPHSKSR